MTAGTTFVRRRRIARLICHEVCHQWYGDIVTPQSFDELWLKEVSAAAGRYNRSIGACWSAWHAYEKTARPSLSTWVLKRRNVQSLSCIFPS